MNVFDVATRKFGEPERCAEGSLVEMLPSEYREEVSKILERNPKTLSILLQCKQGEIDYWEAIALVRQPKCQGCQHYSRGWCALDRPGSLVNTEFLERFPMEGKFA